MFVTSKMASADGNFPDPNKKEKEIAHLEKSTKEENVQIIASTSYQFSKLAEQYPDSPEEDEIDRTSENTIHRSQQKDQDAENSLKSETVCKDDYLSTVKNDNAATTAAIQSKMEVSRVDPISSTSMNIVEDAKPNQLAESVDQKPSTDSDSNTQAESEAPKQSPESVDSKCSAKNVDPEPPAESVDTKPPVECVDRPKPTSESVDLKSSSESVDPKPSSESVDQKPSPESVDPKPIDESVDSKPSAESVHVDQKSSSASVDSKPSVESVHADQKSSSASVDSKLPAESVDTNLQTEKPSVCLRPLSLSNDPNFAAECVESRDISENEHMDCKITKTATNPNSKLKTFALETCSDKITCTNQIKKNETSLSFNIEDNKTLETVTEEKTEKKKDELKSEVHLSTASGKSSKATVEKNEIDCEREKDMKATHTLTSLNPEVESDIESGDADSEEDIVGKIDDTPLSQKQTSLSLEGETCNEEKELSCDEVKDVDKNTFEDMEVEEDDSREEIKDGREMTKPNIKEPSEQPNACATESQDEGVRAFKIDRAELMESDTDQNKIHITSPGSIDTSEDSQFSADVANSPASVDTSSKTRTFVNIFKETAMDGETDTSPCMDIQAFEDTPLGTPISMLAASDTNDNPEDTNTSLISTDAGPTPAKKPKQSSLLSAMEELDQHIITVDRLYEYQWPQDGGEWHMLQEQVSEYLNVKSFKRKYPDMYRRFVDKEEKEFLMDRGVVTETLCDLGLTAVRSDEVFDLMYKDYPDKYQEFSAFMHGKQRQTIYEQHKEYDVPNVEKSKMADYLKRAMKSAADFNQQLQRDRKEERRAFLDMQTFNIHYPNGRYKKLPANLTKPSAYPIALIPGQFQEHYSKYTSDELKYLPINTAMFDAPKHVVPAHKVISNTSSEVEDSQEEKTASSDGDSDGSSDSGSNSDADTDKKEEQKKADPVKETTCRRCEKKNKNKKRPKKVKQEIINCSECGAGGHPSCLELTSEMVEVIQTYPWQCMECKTCVECMDPYDEDKMMFCDRCDRGYHTFCVGLKSIPTGRWECKSCKVTTDTPKSKRGIRP